MMFWYIIGLLVVLIGGPKAFAMDNPNYREWKYSKTRIKHVIVAILISLTPIINLIAGGVVIFVLTATFVDAMNSKDAVTSWLNKPLFKDKE